MNLLFKSYLFGAVIGILLEFIMSGSKHHWISNFGLKPVLSMTIFNIYGWGVLFFTAIISYYPNLISFAFQSLLTLFLAFVTLFTSISIFECVSGRLSKMILYGRQTWHHPKKWITCCDGYVSVISSLFFTCALFAFATFVFPHF